jgi:hypothetical protein
MEIERLKSYSRGKYVVEIQKSRTNKDFIDFYLSHIDYGTKMHITSVQEDFDDDPTIFELISKNFESSVAFYKEQYEDGN